MSTSTGTRTETPRTAHDGFSGPAVRPRGSRASAQITLAYNLLNEVHTKCLVWAENDDYAHTQNVRLAWTNAELAVYAAAAPSVRDRARWDDALYRISTMFRLGALPTDIAEMAKTLAEEVSKTVCEARAVSGEDQWARVTTSCPGMEDIAIQLRHIAHLCDVWKSAADKGDRALCGEASFEIDVEMDEATRLFQSTSPAWHSEWEQLAQNIKGCSEPGDFAEQLRNLAQQVVHGEV